MIIEMQEKPDRHGNPDEPYYCSFRYLVGMLLLKRVVWWKICRGGYPRRKLKWWEL